MDNQTDTGYRDLERRHLEALRSVAAEGTFGRAATRLGYTQSAVSQQIAGLERIVGEKVFDRPRGPRAVRLTAAGRMLLRHAESVLDQIAFLSRELNDYKAGTTGRIELGVFQSIAVKVVPTVVGRLRQAAPNVDVRPHEDRDDRRLVAKVAAGQLDLTFTAGATDPNLRTVDLARDPFVAVIPSDSLDGDTVTLAELAATPLIGQPIEDSCQLKIDAGLAVAGVNADYVFRTADNAAVQSMVRAGMGIAILPLLAVDTNDPDIRICKLEPPIPARELKLVVDPDPSPVTEQFIQLAVDFCHEAIATAPV